MKIHLGCGTVYLVGYNNVDANPDFLSSEADSHTLAENSTTFENYYKHKFGEGTTKSVADTKGDIRNLPFDDESCDEVVMLHVLEHFPAYEVGGLLKEISRVLKVGGEFIVAVPDTVGNAELLVNASNEDEVDWAIRLIDGTQRNKWSHHYCSYTRRSLCELLEEYEFGDFEPMDNKNFYPAIHIKAKKL